MKRLLFCMLVMVVYSVTANAQTVTNNTNCPVLVEGFCYLAGNCDYLPNQPGYTPTPPCGGCGGLAPITSFNLTASGGGFNSNNFPSPPCSGFPFAMDFAYRICMLDIFGQPCRCSSYWSTDPTCPYYSTDPNGGESMTGAGQLIMSGGSGCDCSGIVITWDANGNATIN